MGQRSTQGKGISRLADACPTTGSGHNDGASFAFQRNRRAGASAPWSLPTAEKPLTSCAAPLLLERLNFLIHVTRGLTPPARLLNSPCHGKSRYVLSVLRSALVRPRL